MSGANRAFTGYFDNFKVNTGTTSYRALLKGDINKMASEVKLLTIIFVSLCSLLLSSCQSPYIGKYIKSYDSPTVCKISSYPAECEIKTTHFIFNIFINHSKNNTVTFDKDRKPFPITYNYDIKANVKLIRPGVFRNTQSASYYDLFFIEKHQIIGTISLPFSEVIEEGSKYGNAFISGHTIDGVFVQYRITVTE